MCASNNILIAYRYQLKRYMCIGLKIKYVIACIRQEVQRKGVKQKEYVWLEWIKQMLIRFFIVVYNRWGLYRQQTKQFDVVRERNKKGMSNQLALRLSDSLRKIVGLQVSDKGGTVQCALQFRAVSDVQMVSQ